MTEHRSSPRSAVLRTGGFLLAVALLLVAGGCPPRIDDRSLRWVTAAEAETLMTAKTGPMGLGGTANGLFVDPRTVSSFEKGHIPGAVNIPFPTMTQLFPILKDRTVIIVYGNDYGDDLGAVASKKLLELGAKEVKTLRGGLKAWEQAGGTIAKGS